MSHKGSRLQKCRQIHKQYAHFGNIMFICILLFIGVIGLLFPLRPHKSAIEKRDLTVFPNLTASSFLSGDYFSQISTWYADTFPFRENLIAANTKLETLYGNRSREIHGKIVTGDAVPAADADLDELKKGTDKTLEDGTIHAAPEQAGTVYIADDRAFEIYGFSEEGAVNYISMVNSVAKNLKGKAHVYCLLAPTSIAVNLDEQQQKDMNCSSEADAFDFIYGHLDNEVTSVPVLDDLIKHNAEYLYYRTDHHWTADGAYYAYTDFMAAQGKKAAPLSSFQKNENPGFLGTFYSSSGQSETLLQNPDTVVTYTPSSNTSTYEEGGENYDGKVIYDGSAYSEENKYLCFIGGDHALTKITNPNITDNSSIVVVKESYGNAFVPFLVNSYQNVYVIDYRYYSGNLYDLVEKNHIQDVLYLTNASAIIGSMVDSMNTIL